MGIHVHLHDARKRIRIGDYGTSEGARKAAQTRGTGRHIYRGGPSQSTSKGFTGYNEKTGGHRPKKAPTSTSSGGYRGYADADGTRTYDWFRDGLKGPV